MKKSMRSSVLQGIGQQVRTIRKERQWSQADVAKRMGTSQEYISRIELGLTAIRIDTLNRLAYVLGCRVEISLTIGGR